MKAKDNLVSTIGKEDSAETYFNKEFNESYHSYVGPIIEAKHKFIEPSNLSDLFSRKDSIKILDPFFGLGYNTGVFIQEALNITSNSSVEVTAIEKDSEIVKKIKSLNVPDDYSKTKDFLGQIDTNNQIKLSNIQVNLTVNDVNNILPNLENNYFDLIFFDPFSYKTTPEFWEDSFLIKMFNLLSPSGKLCTYSSMKKLEELAINNGLKVEKVSPLGRKKYSLVVVK